MKGGISLSKKKGIDSARLFLLLLLLPPPRNKLAVSDDQFLDHLVVLLHLAVVTLTRLRLAIEGTPNEKEEFNIRMNRRLYLYQCSLLQR